MTLDSFNAFTVTVTHQSVSGSIRDFIYIEIHVVKTLVYNQLNLTQCITTSISDYSR